MNDKLIIGISGRAKAGKDTVADYLIARNLVAGKVSIAASLKVLCHNLFNIPLVDMYDRKGSNTDIIISAEIANLLPGLKGRIGEYLTIRELLQFFGTDIVRVFNNDCWINLCINEIKAHTGSIYVVPDVRFPNEAQAIQRAGGFVIRLTRNPLDMMHITETALDNYTGFDMIYDNADEDVMVTLENVTKLLKEKII